MCKNFEVKDCVCAWVGGCTPICPVCSKLESTDRINIISTSQEFREWAKNKEARNGI